MNKPEKLILDYSKWRCGSDGINQLGTGFTRLLNQDGFSCCIGQWSKQCGANDSDILDMKSPLSMGTDIPLFITRDGFRRDNNQFAYDCMGINDNLLTTPEEKIEKLSKRLSDEGIQLEVINKP